MRLRHRTMDRASDSNARLRDLLGAYGGRLSPPAQSGGELLVLVSAERREVEYEAEAVTQ